MLLGVLQSTLHEPTLFLIYINHLPCASEFPNSIFAVDDMNLVFCKNQDEWILLKKFLEKIPKWLSVKKFAPNIGKTRAKTFSRNQGEQIINSDPVFEQPKGVK